MKDHTITLSGELTPPQVAAALRALADYYEACGKWPDFFPTPKAEPDEEVPKPVCGVGARVAQRRTFAKLEGRLGTVVRVIEGWRGERHLYEILWDGRQTKQTYPDFCFTVVSTASA